MITVRSGRPGVIVVGMSLSLEPGSAFPDIELPDHVGNRRRLSQLVAEDPVVLQFYRG